MLNRRLDIVRSAVSTFVEDIVCSAVSTFVVNSHSTEVRQTCGWGTVYYLGYNVYMYIHMVVSKVWMKVDMGLKIEQFQHLRLDP